MSNVCCATLVLLALVRATAAVSGALLAVVPEPSGYVCATPAARVALKADLGGSARTLAVGVAGMRLARLIWLAALG